jgi:hypothetical protein
MKTLTLALALLAAAPLHAQMSDMAMPKQSGPAKPVLSPPATATTSLPGTSTPLVIHYSAPSMRGRKIFGGLVPYDQVWRTGANPATTLITPIALKIGDLTVPAGTYTLFTLPSADTWQFIVSKKTGEWGIPYPAGFDLGRTPMHAAKLPSPQEVMTISFVKAGPATQLHIKWDTTDEWVDITPAK